MFAVIFQSSFDRVVTNVNVKAFDDFEQADNFAKKIYENKEAKWAIITPVLKAYGVKIERNTKLYPYKWLHG